MSKKSKLLKVVLTIMDIAFVTYTKRRKKNNPIHKDD